MTLTEIVDENPTLFYEQEWWRGQGFAMEPARTPVEIAERFRFVPYPGAGVRPKLSAADLARVYIENHDDPRFRSFIWTGNRDDYGNRVYVGGVGRYGIEKFQIHRHLADPGACEVVV